MVELNTTLNVESWIKGKDRYIRFSNPPPTLSFFSNLSLNEKTPYNKRRASSTSSFGGRFKKVQISPLRLRGRDYELYISGFIY